MSRLIKVVATFKRRAGMTSDEFSARYLSAPSCSALEADTRRRGVRPGVYAQNHTRILKPDREPPYDSVTELGFADWDALARWNDRYFGPGAAELRADEEHFMDLDSRVIVVTEADVQTPNSDDSGQPD